MKKKQWQIAILIAAILAIAFFWNGDFGKSTVSVDDSNTQSHAKDATASSSIAEEQPEQAYSEDDDASAPSESADSPVVNTDAAKQAEASGHSSDSAETAGATGTDGATGSAAVATGSDGATGTSSVAKGSDGATGSAGSTGKTASEQAQPSGLDKPTAQTGKGPEKAATSGNGKNSTASQPPGKGAPSKPPASAPKPDKSTVQQAKPTKKDKYLTDPVPEGKPKPVEWQDTQVDKKKELTVTLSVTAATILDNLDQFNEDKLEVLPKDGIIFKARTVTFYEGESVFDVLLREMRKHKIHMEFEMTPIYNSNYIEGINNIYEFDCGELSGWMYKVNGWFPNYGSSRYALKDGDVIEWVYTCDLGRDIGGDMAAAGGRE